MGEAEALEPLGADDASGLLAASCLRLLTFMILRWSPLAFVFAPVFDPFTAWASPIVAAPFVAFTLPFCCCCRPPALASLLGEDACTCTCVAALDAAGGLTGSRSDCTNQTKENKKEEIVGHMRREREVAHCEP